MRRKQQNVIDVNLLKLRKRKKKKRNRKREEEPRPNNKHVRRYNLLEICDLFFVL